MVQLLETYKMVLQVLSLTFSFQHLNGGGNICYCFFVSCRYVRAEVLAGFVNGLFLIFTAFFIFSEGVEVRCDLAVSLSHFHL